MHNGNLKRLKESERIPTVNLIKLVQFIDKLTFLIHIYLPLMTVINLQLNLNQYTIYMLQDNLIKSCLLLDIKKNTF